MTTNAQREISVNQFEGIIQSHETVVVKIGEYGCPPCRRYDRMVIELMDEFSGKVEFVCIDGDTIPHGSEESRSFKRAVGPYTGVPYITIFKNGERTEGILGFRDNTELREAINRVLCDSNDKQNN
ncbi:thioredoxin family protein [Candidatus Peribacteria bacterium]|jgi:thiol-disulfide isomerase/thioredoxin|nr:thioredoxin family protein [Candidatus Peribacteria bacterium]MBT4021260.1 thioredoxin family protein [Candidatus Peribacteria bacterium]MBT4240675.1 thioredoxin family protein [Candidatus Peribacteria bacterium]MBT4474020.1 thioredoxin family protein [Candidatus Peribacteria bacterium]